MITNISEWFFTEVKLVWFIENCRFLLSKIKMRNLENTNFNLAHNEMIFYFKALNLYITEVNMKESEIQKYRKDYHFSIIQNPMKFKPKGISKYKIFCELINENKVFLYERISLKKGFYLVRHSESNERYLKNPTFEASLKFLSGYSHIPTIKFIKHKKDIIDVLRLCKKNERPYLLKDLYDGKEVIFKKYSLFFYQNKDTSNLEIDIGYFRIIDLVGKRTTLIIFPNNTISTTNIREVIRNE